MFKVAIFPPRNFVFFAIKSINFDNEFLSSQTTHRNAHPNPSIRDPPRETRFDRLSMNNVSPLLLDRQVGQSELRLRHGTADMGPAQVLNTEWARRPFKRCARASAKTFGKLRSSVKTPRPGKNARGLFEENTGDYLSCAPDPTSELN